MPESATRIEERTEVPRPALSPLRVKVVSEAVEDGVDMARRAVKRARYAAEDLMDETAHRIKQYPFRAVALTFGLAFGTGILFGCIGSRIACGRGRAQNGDLHENRAA